MQEKPLLSSWHHPHDSWYEATQSTMYDILGCSADMHSGVALTESSDDLGQKYMTPECAVGRNNSDIIIVGRAILNVSTYTQYTCIPPLVMILPFGT